MCCDPSGFGVGGDPQMNPGTIDTAGLLGDANYGRPPWKATEAPAARADFA